MEQTSLGRKLREIRENKNMGLHELSQRTKVGRTILKAIEEDDTKHMPGKTYVRGFIKSYLREMGVSDTKPLMAEFDLQYNFRQVGAIPENKSIPNPIPRATPSATQQLNARRPMLLNKSSMPMAIGAILLAIIVPTILFNFQSISDSVGKWFKKDTIQQVEEIAQASIVPSGPTPTENIAANSSIINPVFYLEYSLITHQFIWRDVRNLSLFRKREIQPDIPNALVTLPTALAATPERSNIEFPVVEFFPIKKVNYSLADATNDNVSWGNYNEQMPVNVKLMAIEASSWMTFKVDDRPIQVVLLQKGQSMEIQGKELAIYMGNFHASRVYYNKQRVDSPKGTGVKNFIFPPNAIANYKTPLFVHHASGKIYTSSEYEKLSKN